MFLSFLLGNFPFLILVLAVFHLGENIFVFSPNIVFYRGAWVFRGFASSFPSVGFTCVPYHVDCGANTQEVHMPKGIGYGKKKPMRKPKGKGKGKK